MPISWQYVAARWRHIVGWLVLAALVILVAVGCSAAVVVTPEHERLNDALDDPNNPYHAEAHWALRIAARDGIESGDAAILTIARATLHSRVTQLLASGFTLREALSLLAGRAEDVADAPRH